MANQQGINKLIKAGEGPKLEFKSSFNADVIEKLVAFAIAQGGKVLIGVNKSGQVSGVSIDNKDIVLFAAQEYPLKQSAK